MFICGVSPSMPVHYSFSCKILSRPRSLSVRSSVPPSLLPSLDRSNTCMGEQWHEHRHSRFFVNSPLVEIGQHQVHQARQDAGVVVPRALFLAAHATTTPGSASHCGPARFLILQMSLPTLNRGQGQLLDSSALSRGKKLLQCSRLYNGCAQRACWAKHCSPFCRSGRASLALQPQHGLMTNESLRSEDGKRSVFPPEPPHPPRTGIS
jgi:hypothetical protein